MDAERPAVGTVDKAARYACPDGYIVQLLVSHVFERNVELLKTCRCETSSDTPDAAGLPRFAFQPRRIIHASPKESSPSISTSPKLSREKQACGRSSRKSC